MRQDKQKPIEKETPSLLDRFSIGFEYNKTLSQIREDTKLRAISDIQ